MELEIRNELFQVKTYEEGLKMVESGLKSRYGVVIWKLPFENQIRALFNLSEKQHFGFSDLEELTNCFIINPYTANHPPHPLVLKGDLIITFNGRNTPEVTFNPSLSASQIEAFQEELAKTGTHYRQPDEHFKFNTNDQDGNFQQKVNLAIQHIKKSEAHKIVLSRFQDFQLGENFDALQFFNNLTEAYPNAFCHLSSTSYGVWAGASPERLLSIDQRKYFSTDALAGTQPMVKGKSLKEIAWTQKEIEEQAMVGRYIVNCFKQIRLREFEEIGPRTVQAGNLSHLKTEFKVDMESTNSPRLGSTMMNLLHPTSAVCGFPRETADTFIRETEGYDRQLYAGFLGPVGFDGNTRLYVNLRCLKFEKDKARLFAGAGITEDSDPEKEYQETCYKLQTLLSILQQ